MATRTDLQHALLAMDAYNRVQNASNNSRQTHLNIVQELTTGTDSGFGFDRTA